MSDCCVVQSLGYAALAYLGYRFLQAIYNCVYPFFLASPIGDLKKFSGGEWALITGSTDGIGKAYAAELAKKGFNLILVSRNEQKLSDTKKELQALAKDVQIKTIAFDFSNPNPADYASKLFQPIINDPSINIGVVVNNVGLGYDYPEYYHELPGGDEALANLLIVNSLPPLLLTRMVLSKMVERRKGVIVNIGSASALAPLPLWDVYTASKVFVRQFTQCLQCEYAGKGVTFQLVEPFMVATKMAKVRTASLFVPSAESFAKSAVATIGICAHTFGYWSHAIQGAFLSAIPTCMFQWLAFRQSKAIRAKALKKRAEKDK